MYFVFSHEEILLFSTQVHKPKPVLPQGYWKNAIMKCSTLMKEMIEFLNFDL